MSDLDATAKLLSDSRDLAEKSFYFFAKGICGFDWLDKRVHGPVCAGLQDPDNRRIRTLMPRGWLKTTLCSIAFPVWLATKNPSHRTLLVQNTFTNACSKLAVIRGFFERNTLFRSIYEDLLPNKHSTWKSEKLCINRPRELDSATFEAAGTGTQVTSRHYNLIVEDDTVAPDISDLGEMSVCPTKEDVGKAIGWHRLAPPLLTSMRDDRIVVVGTRWFEEDLLSWVAANEPQYRGVTLSAETDEGEPVWPERFPREVLEALKAALGPYMYSCLYLNKPIRSDDMIFNEGWFKYYSHEPKLLMTYTTVDPAGDPEDSKGEPDWNVVLTCGKDLVDGRVYVLDYQREKCSPGRMIDMIFEQVAKWSPVKVGIETVAYQKSIQYWVREKMRSKNKWFEIEPITNTRRSKNARIMGLQPLFANGAIMLRNWMGELRSELLAFPYGKNDDLADALSMQLGLWTLTSTIADAKAEEPDPWTVEGLIAELRGRYRPPTGVEDVLFIPDNAGRYAQDMSPSWN